MSRAQKLAVGLQVLLCGLLVAWFTWLQPPSAVAALPALAVMLVPSIPGLLLGAFGRRSAAFWCGVSGLFYFSHGVMEAWTVSDTLWLGLAEAALATAVVVAASWDGVRARFPGSRRRGNV